MNQRYARALSFSLPALFAALMAGSAFFVVPVPGSPVPLVLQNLMVVAAGVMLGPLAGGLAVFLFLLLGALGFPVFSGGHGGLAWFAGPTGGYLVGYLLGAILGGLVARKRSYPTAFIGAAIGFLVILAVGALRLKFAKDLSWSQAFGFGVLPFLFGDALKAGLVGLLACKLGPFFDTLAPPRKRGLLAKAEARGS